MNNKKVCFISCVNNDRQYEECLIYLNNLNVPEGYDVEIISIKEATSMAAGYNEAMNYSDAKYKVYLHQDTFIINKDFIFDILEVFNLEDNIGMLGVVGAKVIPMNGIWWESNEKYGQVYDSHEIEMKNLNFKEVENNFEKVKCIDGLIMVTQYDIPWREDVFDGWHFYDISQSLEFKRSGYKVIVPKQENSWIIHDCELVKTQNGFEKYKSKFIEEYSKDIFPLVSILIPTYNRPEYLKQALLSAINQSYKNIEIIIGDDSTNNETEILIKEQFINKYENIKYYHNDENLGQFDNDIKLYNIANGEFINYLMDDDLFELVKIEKMMNYFIQDINQEFSLITSHRGIIDENGNFKSVFANTDKIFNNNIIINGIELGNELISSFNFIGEPTTVLFRKKKLTEYFGVFNCRKYGPNVDQASWLNLLSNGKAVYINEILSYFRIHEGQQQNDNNIIVKGYIDHAHTLLTCRKKKFLLDDKKYVKALKKLIDDFKILLKDNQEYIKINKDYEEIRFCYKKLKKSYKDLEKKLQCGIRTNLKKKNILITNHYLINFSGSEIVTLNLAKAFKLKGYNVIVGTFNYDYPIKELFEKEDIQVYLLSNSIINDLKVDIIWAQHFTTLYYVLFNKNIVASKIINNIMSPYESLEAPSIFGNLISLNVVNSNETKEKIINEGIEEKKIYIMPNPVENNFVNKYNIDRKCELKNISIVSNHVPIEVYNAATKLRSLGYNVDIYGMNDNYVYISPELLQNYDAVITIGKTVQYSMIMGLPVYCYDKFGGPGWINNENFYESYKFNFSGRCSNRKIDSDKIVEEIIDGYKGAFKERENFYKFACENFILVDNLDKILNIINKNDEVDINFIKKIYGMVKRQNNLYLNI